MDVASSFLPLDRRLALAGGDAIPPASTGAALFADLGGFTPLTAHLAALLGPQHGADALSTLLNAVYDALIAQVHSYGGSVVNLSGDGITCWFAGDPGARAVAAALALQQAMGAFAAVPLPAGDPVRLTLKCAVAAGPVRRQVVGDPQYGLFDTLAGATLERLSAAEQQARPGEVVLDAATARSLAEALPDLAWRGNSGAGAEVAVVRTAPPVPITPWPAPPALPATVVRPWLRPLVWERLGPGQEVFLAEIRPVVPLFLRFAGLDYDGDPTGDDQLDAYVRWAQGVLARYDAVLLSLTIGDKGSYLHTAFGAPVAHSDDAARAAAAALELRTPPPTCPAIRTVQIGLSQGLAWVGAYGASTCRAYDVQGDAVNLAARLMSVAPPGSILAATDVQVAAGPRFAWTTLAPLPVKGKATPVAVARLEGAAARAPGLLEPAPDAPLVGRAAEKAALTEALAAVQAGQGRIVAVLGEAGIGKSRLVAATVAAARAQGLPVYAGAAESYRTHTAYLAWQPLWQAFFGVDGALSDGDLADHLAARLAAIRPELAERAPLLGAVLGSSLPDTPLTAHLQGALRKTSLEALLVDCLRAAGGDTPSLLVLEDIHWLDPLSADLLDAIGRALATTPVLLLLTARPAEQTASGRGLALAGLPHYRALPLAHLPAADALRLAAGRIERRQVLLAPALIERLVERAGGNPFYLEELLNYLLSRNPAALEPSALDSRDWPASLQSLLLARIDQLSESQRRVLKTASIIGRLFVRDQLWGVHPGLGPLPEVQADLQVLEQFDLTPLDSPGPEWRYLFKHQVTHDVTYGSVPPTRRARLHEQFAGWLEAQSAASGAAPPLDLLAYHYGQSANTAKQREYLRRAAEAAQAAYANESAMDYYRRLLPLLPEAEQAGVLLPLAQIYVVIGQWGVAEDLLRQAHALASAHADSRHLARSHLDLGTLLLRKGENAEAQAALTTAQTLFEQLGDVGGQLDVLTRQGQLYWRLNQDAEARACFERHLALATTLGESHRNGPLLINLGNYYWRRHDLPQALAHYEQALEIAMQEEDRLLIAQALGNMGLVYKNQGHLQRALACYEQDLMLAQEVGDRQTQAQVCGNIGTLFATQGEYDQTLHCEQAKLQICTELGDRRGCMVSLNNICEIFCAWGELDTAHEAATIHLALARRLGDRRYEQEALYRLAQVAADRGDYAAAVHLAGESLAGDEAARSPDRAAQAACLTIVCRLRLGEIDPGTALAEVDALRARWTEPAIQADLCYTAWQCDPTAPGRAATAAGAQAAAHAEMPLAEYRARYAAITGAALPAPPPLPPLPALIPTAVPPLATLIAAARLLATAP